MTNKELMDQKLLDTTEENIRELFKAVRELEKIRQRIKEMKEIKRRYIFLINKITEL